MYTLLLYTPTLKCQLFADNENRLYAGFRNALHLKPNYMHLMHFLTFTIPPVMTINNDQVIMNMRECKTIDNF